MAFLKLATTMLLLAYTKPAASAPTHALQQRDEHFWIKFQRYSDPSGKAKLGDRTLIKDDSGCISWPDGQAFRSFQYIWQLHGSENQMDQKNPADHYGHCVLHLYEDTECMNPGVVGDGKGDDVPGANDWDMIGDFF